MNGTLIQPQQVLKRDPDTFLHRRVQDLFSLKGRTIVVTGGARGIGLSFGFAVAEAGGDVAILDALSEPHEHFYKLEKDYGVKVRLYKSVSPHCGISGPRHHLSVADFERQERCYQLRSATRNV